MPETSSERSPHRMPANVGVGAKTPPLSKLPGENRVIWTLWLAYGAFYFCRTNISAAVPGLKAPIADGGLGLTGDQVGWILASLKIAYGVGQLLNGQLSERISPRVMLAVGMFGSAALNLMFGFGAGFLFLLFVWASNGFCQSLGWTPCIRVTANWVPIHRRGHAIGIIGTGYQITQGLIYVIAGQSAEYLGWRGALFVPAGLLAASGVFMLFFLKDAPPSYDGGPQKEGGPAQAASTKAVSLTESLYWTLYNPSLWLLGLSLGLLNACRYGFLDWGIVHLMETRDIGVGKAGLQFFVIAIGATAGSYLAGWATDRYFGSRRAPVICILMVMLGVLTLVYNSAVESSVAATVLILVIIGFCIYGPQVLLVGTAPADLAHRNTSAAAAGFVNFMGYMGAATGDIVTGYYSDAANGGWVTAIYIWAGWAFGGAIVMGILWNTTSRKVGLIPGVIPKLSAIATLLVASFAVTGGEQHTILLIATYAAALCMTATFVTRWAALPGLLLSGLGLIVVFVSYLQSGESVTWNESLAMLAYGLTLIIALMVLVEIKVETCELS